MALRIVSHTRKRINPNDYKYLETEEGDEILIAEHAYEGEDQPITIEH